MKDQAFVAAQTESRLDDRFGPKRPMLRRG